MAAPTVQAVVPRSSRQEVFALASVQSVMPAPARDRVAPLVAYETVRSSVPEEHIRPPAPLDVLDTPNDPLPCLRSRTIAVTDLVLGKVHLGGAGAAPVDETQPIIPFAAADVPASSPAREEDVVATPTVHQLGARSPHERVRAAPRLDPVSAIAGIDVIVPGARAHEIRRCLRQDVVATPARHDDVDAAGAHDAFGARAADDGGALPHAPRALRAQGADQCSHENRGEDNGDVPTSIPDARPSRSVDPAPPTPSARGPRLVANLARVAGAGTNLRRRSTRTRAACCVLTIVLAALPGGASSASIWDRKGMEPYRIPLDRELLSRAAIVRPHHDYPSTDLYVPSGSLAYSVQAGRVRAVLHDGRCGLGIVIDGVDGYRYTYCHGSSALVSAGDRVHAGQKVMRTGNSGSSGRPHLHFEIEDASLRLICPQPLILSWWMGAQKTPAGAPYGGCSY